MYIILEYYLIENFIINFFILYITKMITRTKTKNRHVVLGAFLGALYSLVFFYPYLMFLTTIPMKIILSALIIRVSFKTNNIKLFIKEVLGFYLVSFIFAGATIGVFFTSTDILDLLYKPLFTKGRFPVSYLVLGVSFSVIIGSIIFTYHNRKIVRENNILEVDIYFKGKSISINALIDTGNSLITPFTNKPVFVVEYEKLKSILPDSLNELFILKKLNDFNEIERILREIEEEILLNIIPFKSVGEESGVLFAFKPEYIRIIYDKENEIVDKDTNIGIYNGKFSSDLSYNGLLNNEILVRGMCNENATV